MWYFFIFLMHTVAIQTLMLAKNKVIRKSWRVTYVFIGKSRSFLVHKYYDIGSTADCQVKYDLHLLIMMLGRFPIIYLSRWYISDSQDVVIIKKITVRHAVTEPRNTNHICWYRIFDNIISLLFSLQGSNTNYNTLIKFTTNYIVLYLCVLVNCRIASKKAAS